MFVGIKRCSIHVTMVFSFLIKNGMLSFRMLIVEYLNPVNFDLVTSVTGNQPKVQSLEQQLRGLAVTNNSHGEDTTAAKMNRNIVQMALYLEGFGNFAKV